MKTQSESLAEAKKLRKMKPSVLPRSMFGDDHHAAIDAQIEVLEQDLSEDDIDERADEDNGDWTEGQRDAAMEARYWVDGHEKISPSENWQSLVRK